MASPALPPFKHERRCWRRRAGVSGALRARVALTRRACGTRVGRECARSRRSRGAPSRSQRWSVLGTGQGIRRKPADGDQGASPGVSSTRRCASSGGGAIEARRRSRASSRRCLTIVCSPSMPPSSPSMLPSRSPGLRCAARVPARWRAAAASPRHVRASLPVARSVGSSPNGVTTPGSSWRRPPTSTSR